LGKGSFRMSLFEGRRVGCLQANSEKSLNAPSRPLCPRVHKPPAYTFSTRTRAHTHTHTPSGRPHSTTGYGALAVGCAAVQAVQAPGGAQPAGRAAPPHQVRAPGGAEDDKICRNLACPSKSVWELPCKEKGVGHFFVR